MPSRAQAPKILVVDDDVRLRDLLTRYLSEQGFQVAALADANQLDKKLQRDPPHLIVLDLMLPGEDGLTVCRRLRGAGESVPIIMLTAKGEDIDRIVGLEMGADDYIPKPFDPRELVARIRAVLRRAEVAPATPPAFEQIEVGELVADLASREARSGASTLMLTPLEFDILVELMRSAGRVLSRDQLSRTVLGRPAAEDDRSVDTHIFNLRRKLGKAPDGRPAIRTVRGAGFLLPRPSDAA